MPVFLLLLLAMVAEITVLVTVGGWIGVLPTIGLLVLATLVGGALLRREGTRAFANFQRAVAERRPPQREMVDGVLITAAAFLVLLPGFISDVLAILLLFPPTRSVVRAWAIRRAERMVERRRQTIIVDSTVVHPEEARPTIVIPEARREDR